MSTLSVKCKKCNEKTLIIEIAPDSYYKIVKCQTCGWWIWLKHYKQKESK